MYQEKAFGTSIIFIEALVEKLLTMRVGGAVPKYE